MLHDIRARDEVRNLLSNAAIPPFDLADIRRRMQTPGTRSPEPRLGARLVAAAIALLVADALLTARSPAVMQNIEENYRAALAAAGIGVGLPVSAPPDIRARTRPVLVSLARARRVANFHLVPPTGIPNDVKGGTIYSEPIAVWSRGTNTWTFDGVALTFRYVRGDGRTFDIVASRYAPADFPAPRYIYLVEDTPSTVASVIAYRQENFVWRNGDQTLSVLASPEVSSREIERMRVSMNGVALPRVDTRHEKHRSDHAARFVIPKPGTAP